MTIKSIAFIAATVSAVAAVATPVVQTVRMEQSSSSRLVTITYTMTSVPAVVTLDVQTNYTENGEVKWASIGGQAVCNAQGAAWRKVTAEDASGDEYTITWRPDISWPGHKVADGGARAVVTAWSVDNTPNYMVVDISAGARQNTQRYYQSAEFVPYGVTNSFYKTSSLLMRKIPAKGVTWTMGAPSGEVGAIGASEKTHQVKLDGNYYISVYEVTQAQWGEVATNNTTASANFTVERLMRPMEKVCYNEIRLNSGTRDGSASEAEIVAYSWPSNPAPASFLGLLRLKTGIDFDLPSDAQWEFAARSGHGAGLWNDGSAIVGSNSDDNLARLGRYVYDNPGGGATTTTLAPSDGGTAVVGTYAPSSWGLYDMHGNVLEWCLDWYEDDVANAVDADGEPYAGRVNILPENPTCFLSGADASSAGRVIRSGSWNGVANGCRSAARANGTSTTRARHLGFRLVCTCGLR